MLSQVSWSRRAQLQHTYMHPQHSHFVLWCFLIQKCMVSSTGTGGSRHLSHDEVAEHLGALQVTLTNADVPRSV